MTWTPRGELPPGLIEQAVLVVRARGEAMRQSDIRLDLLSFGRPVADVSKPHLRGALEAAQKDGVLVAQNLTFRAGDDHHGSSWQRRVWAVPNVPERVPESRPASPELEPISGDIATETTDGGTTVKRRVQQVVDHLAGQRDPQSATAIATALGVSRRTANRALQAASKAGLVQSGSVRTGRGRPFNGWWKVDSATALNRQQRRQLKTPRRQRLGRRIARAAGGAS